ncbi:hypothetical protein HN51_054351 [Arachis hypogaea]
MVRREQCAWAMGKASEDKVHVAVSVEQGLYMGKERIKKKKNHELWRLLPWSFGAEEKEEYKGRIKVVEAVAMGIWCGREEKRKKKKLWCGREEEKVVEATAAGL